MCRLTKTEWLEWVSNLCTRWLAETFIIKNFPFVNTLFYIVHECFHIATLSSTAIVLDLVVIADSALFTDICIIINLYLRFIAVHYYEKWTVFAFAVRRNVLINGTLKDTVSLDSWFTTGFTVMVSQCTAVHIILILMLLSCTQWMSVNQLFFIYCILQISQFIQDVNQVNASYHSSSFCCCTV